MMGATAQTSSCRPLRSHSNQKKKPSGDLSSNQRALILIDFVSALLPMGWYLMAGTIRPAQSGRYNQAGTITPLGATA